MYRRLCNPLLSNSFFLFGARGTGKSTLIRELLASKKILQIDLLDEEVAHRLMAHPGEFEKQILAQAHEVEWVFVDEIQRVPVLLNYVHRLIEGKKLKFALTGSSARKLKRGKANLLAGRALLNTLHPLVQRELGEDFRLTEVLQWGSLPKVITSPDLMLKREYLKTYVQTYLREEIKEEQLVRRLDPFLRFLEVSAQCNGSLLNFSKIARDCSTDPQMVERYFEILIDTLLGFYLDPFHESVRKRQNKRQKFYFFDLGVKRALDHTLGVELVERTSAYGEAFEHFFILECIRLNDYLRRDYRFSYLRTKDDVEIDLIVERPGKKRILIEIKSTDRIHEKDFRTQIELARSVRNSEFWIVSNDPLEMQGDGYRAMGWEKALGELFGGDED